MKRIITFMLAIFTVTTFSFAGEITAKTKKETKIEKRLLKIDAEFKIAKDIQKSSEQIFSLFKRFGQTIVTKKMAFLKTCMETCYDNYQRCMTQQYYGPNQLAGLPPNPTFCQNQYVACWLLGCGLWGS